MLRFGEGNCLMWCASSIGAVRSIWTQTVRIELQQVFDWLTVDVYLRPDRQLLARPPTEISPRLDPCSTAIHPSVQMHMHRHVLSA
jgi:hypothetical protein